MNNLSRPEHTPKTPLASRLREIRRLNGDPDRAEFASILQISKNTIAFYERGERTPDAHVLYAYNKCFHVDLNWLVTGEINNKLTIQEFDNNRLSSVYDNINKMTLNIGRLILSLAKELSIELSNDKFLQLLSFAMKQILRRVDDLSDFEEIESIFPQIRLLLRKKLPSYLE